MYPRETQHDTPPKEFQLPVGGKLAEDNRWVILAQIIPWGEFEQEYAAKFKQDIGAPAKTFRMAMGALIIKEKLGISDREIVEQIRENPYLQYFIGMTEYSNEAPFDPSMMVHFRERIDIDLVKKLNQEIVIKASLVEEEAEVKTKKSEVEVEDSKSEIKNQGKLILDASCAPADITYPTDIGLLNKSRKYTERIIDILYKKISVRTIAKPRTYRKIARKRFLEIVKRKRPTILQRRTAIKKQLQYIRRNLGHIQQLIDEGASLLELSKREYKILLVISEVYRQQLWLYENKKRKIEDRIVSLTQPHIRPIVRGKAAKNTEFGAKFSASCFDGYVFLDNISWNNFNESGDFKLQVETYKSFTGHYPESVHVDKIYRTRENRAWCKERGIRISGPPLGRPPKDISQETKKQAREDEAIRNSIEGKFGESSALGGFPDLKQLANPEGQGKRRFTLGHIMAKLPHTALTSIALTFLVMNLSTLLSRLLWGFFCLFFRITPFFDYLMNKVDEFVVSIQRKLIFTSVRLYSS